MITDDGCWAEVRGGAASPVPRPALLLDRDGVLIEDTGYPHRAKDIILIRETLELVRVASAAGFAVCIVTNQSGIGRGLFGWPEFQAVQHAIDTAVAKAGGQIDAVFACPFHVEATIPALAREHPWRKPAPGMIMAARLALNIDGACSALVGDRVSDIVAAEAGCIGHRFLLTAASGRQSGYDCVRREDLLALFKERVVAARSKENADSVRSGDERTGAFHS